MRSWHAADVVLRTSGTGLWSSRSCDVGVSRLEVVGDSPEFGELRVYFDVDGWDVVRDGLIYTDKAFLDGLRRYLVDVLNFSPAAVDDVHFSEQGMQGTDYVSFDVGERFLGDWYVTDDYHGDWRD